MLTDADHAQAPARAEGIRKACAALVAHHRSGTLPPATVSIVVANFRGHGHTPETLPRMAGQLRYRANYPGRDRVAPAGEAPVAQAATARIHDT